MRYIFTTLVLCLLTQTAHSFDLGKFVGGVANQVINNSNNNANTPNQAPNPNAHNNFQSEYNAINAKLSACPPRDNGCIMKYANQLQALQQRGNAYSGATGDRNFDGKVDAIDQRLSLDDPLINSVGKRRQDQFNNIVKEYNNRK